MGFGNTALIESRFLVECAALFGELRLKFIETYI